MNYIITKILVFLTLGVALTGFLYKKKNFEGRIVFKSEVFGKDAAKRMQSMGFPDEYAIGKNFILIKLWSPIKQDSFWDYMRIDLKTGETYQIHVDDKYCSRMPNLITGSVPEDSTKPVFARVTTMVPMDEIITILGYKCRKYERTTSVRECTKTEYLWLTDRYRVNTVYHAGCSKEGIALKAMYFESEDTIVHTAVSLVEEELPESIFDFPAGFTVTH